MLRVAAYTSGWTDPSARFRVRQYIPAIARLGVDVVEYPAAFGSYAPRSKTIRPFWCAAALAERSVKALRSARFDVTLLQRQMIATLCSAEVLTARPRVLDVDDAIWLRDRGSAAERIAKRSDLVICGNNYLADAFGRWTRFVAVLPTAVDTERFLPGTATHPRQPVIGWSGSSSGFPFLQRIAPAIAQILEEIPEAVLRVVADRPPELPFSRRQVEFERWSPETEVRSLQSFTVGIMPLDDTLWARGKCSFKLLTYLSCGIPAIGSPIGMNAEILRACGGLAPRTRSEWVDALRQAIDNSSWAERARRRGRETVQHQYSLQKLAPRFASLLGATFPEVSH